MSLYTYNNAISFELPDEVRLIESANDDVCNHYIIKEDITQEDCPVESLIGKIMEIEIDTGNNELDSYREVFRAIADYYNGSKYFITPSPYECMIINIPFVIEESDNKSGIIIVVPAGSDKMACILISGTLDGDNENEIYKSVLFVASALTIDHNTLPISDITCDDLKEALKLSYDEEISVDVSNEIFSVKTGNENQKESDNVEKSVSIDSSKAGMVCLEDDNNRARIAKEREKVRIELIDAKLELSRAKKIVESNNESIMANKEILEEKRKGFADYIDTNMADIEYNKTRITSEQIKQRSLIKDLEFRKSEMKRSMEETKKDLEGTSFFRFSLKKELSNKIEDLDSQIKECDKRLTVEKTKLNDLDAEFKDKVLSPQQNIDAMGKNIEDLETSINKLIENNNVLAKTIEIKSIKVLELGNELKRLQD